MLEDYLADFLTSVNIFRGSLVDPEMTPPPPITMAGEQTGEAATASLDLAHVLAHPSDTLKESCVFFPPGYNIPLSLHSEDLQAFSQIFSEASYFSFKGRLSVSTLI